MKLDNVHINSNLVNLTEDFFQKLLANKSNFSNNHTYIILTHYIIIMFRFYVPNYVPLCK